MAIHCDLWRNNMQSHEINHHHNHSYCGNSNTALAGVSRSIIIFRQILSNFDWFKLLIYIESWCGDTDLGFGYMCSWWTWLHYRVCCFANGHDGLRVIVTEAVADLECVSWFISWVHHHLLITIHPILPKLLSSFRNTIRHNQWFLLDQH